MTRKDALYVELFASQILNQRLAYLELFHSEIIDLIKLKSEGGPKTDIQRLKALEVIMKTVYKIIQKKDGTGSASLTNFLKSTSKDIKKIIVSVFHSHHEFKQKKVAIIRKYLELSVAFLRAYEATGLGKRFKGLKEAIQTEKSNLPEDSNLMKVLKKIEDHEMVVEEENAAE